MYFSVLFSSFVVDLHYHNGEMIPELLMPGQGSAFAIAFDEDMIDYLREMGKGEDEVAAMNGWISARYQNKYSRQLGKKLTTMVCCLSGMTDRHEPFAKPMTMIFEDLRVWATGSNFKDPYPTWTVQQVEDKVSSLGAKENLPLVRMDGRRYFCGEFFIKLLQYFMYKFIFGGLGYSIPFHDVELHRRLFYATAPLKIQMGV